MAYMTLKKSPSKGSSASTHNFYKDIIKEYEFAKTDWTTVKTYKPGDRVEVKNPGWVYDGKNWQTDQYYTKDYVDNLSADYQKKLEAKDKEIEELQKALTTLIGVKNGEST